MLRSVRSEYVYKNPSKCYKKMIHLIKPFTTAELYVIGLLMVSHVNCHGHNNCHEHNTTDGPASLAPIHHAIVSQNEKWKIKQMNNENNLA